MAKGNKAMISATDPVMVEILKRMGCKQEARSRILQGNIGPLADGQRNPNAPSDAPILYTPESLGSLERKDLFTIADSKGISYPPNVPTARLIDQIMASQAG